MSDPTNPTLTDIEARLAISLLQAEAGITVPMAPAMRRLRESIDDLEASQRDQPRREATPRR